MGLKSGGKSNMFMVFHGYGQNENLLNGIKLSLKYNGALAEAKGRVLRPNQDASRVASITPPKWVEEP